ncbi:DUF3108 domain-containing protein [Gemmatimonas sp.]|jgi:hypothetical protein|uniref:DUF3108 domain-containing protein n=1 Tax=Gemmatimonas sp. TaxID=1962908 RepID=UPI0037BFC7BF
MSDAPFFRLVVALLGGTLSSLAPVFARAQPAASREYDPASRLPFPLGEVLDYRVSVSLGGNIGRGQMRVEGPVTERGIPTWRLVSEMQAKRAFVKATDRTTSWVDPVKFATLRFEKSERHPLARSDEQVEMNLVAGTWRDDDGREQTLGSPLPLDELSFLYFLRTIPLDQEGSYQYHRHFDEQRNPTLVTVGAEETVQTEAGRFTTRVVIMHVKDPAHYQGVGLIRINLDTSPCHIPVRIVSRMPIVGTTTLSLVARSANARCEA